MPKYTIGADDGTQFIGPAELVDNLPEEFAKQIKRQIQAASEGKSMEAVRVPRGLLEQAGWITKADFLKEQEDAKAEAVAPSLPIKEQMNQAVKEAARAPIRAPVEYAKPHMCDGCPFKEAAMKLLDKTLKGLE